MNDLVGTVWPGRVGGGLTHFAPPPPARDGASCTYPALGNPILLFEYQLNAPGCRLPRLDLQLRRVVSTIRQNLYPEMPLTRNRQALATVLGARSQFRGPSILGVPGVSNLGDESGRVSIAYIGRLTSQPQIGHPRSRFSPYSHRPPGIQRTGVRKRTPAAGHMTRPKAACTWLTASGCYRLGVTQNEEDEDQEDHERHSRPPGSKAAHELIPPLTDCYRAGAYSPT